VAVLKPGASGPRPLIWSAWWTSEWTEFLLCLIRRLLIGLVDRCDFPRGEGQVCRPGESVLHFPG
ncbi:unnamed protein product, partial [Ectocarpus sp. 12 AP-2014]